MISSWPLWRIGEGRQLIFDCDTLKAEGVISYMSSDHQDIICSYTSQLFVHQFAQADIKVDFKAPHHWPSVKVNSPHKEPVRRKVFLFHDVFVWCCNIASSHDLCTTLWLKLSHYTDVTMSVMASQITGASMVCSTVGSGAADQRKYQSSAALAFVRVIHLWPVNSPHKGLVTRKMFPFNDVIIYFGSINLLSLW